MYVKKFIECPLICGYIDNLYVNRINLKELTTYSEHVTKR